MRDAVTLCAATTTMDALRDDDDDVNVDANADRVAAHIKAHTARIADAEARRRDHALTPRVASALGELAFGVTREIARDVRAYANHASRDVVDGTDVALRARKINPRLRHARDAHAAGDEDDGVVSAEDDRGAKNAAS